MNPVSSLRRHPFLLLAGALLTGVALWIGHFLSTFDLNYYRDQLAEQIGTQLHLPVQMGTAHLVVREGGLAFSFSDLHIGTAETAVELQAEKLWLQLAWRGLLLQKPIISEVSLKVPQLRITPQATAFPDGGTTQERFSLELIRDLHIRQLELQQGSLTINWPASAGRPRTLILDGISAEIDNFGLGHAVILDVTANLPRHGDQARLALKGSVTLPASGKLAELSGDLTLDAKALDAALLTGLLPDSSGISATGRCDFTLNAKGGLADTLSVQAGLSGTTLDLRAGQAAGKPFLLKHLQVAGIWEREADHHLFRQVSAQVNDLRLSGEFSLGTGTNGYQITGRLGNSLLTLDTLRHWFPPALLAANPLLSRRLPGGSLALSDAKFRADIPGGVGEFVSVVLDELHGEGRNLGWDLGSGIKAEIRTFLVSLEDKRWHFERGAGMLAGVPVTFSGTLTPAADGPPGITFDVAAGSTAEQLLALGKATLPADLTVNGPLPLKAHIDGTLRQYSLDVTTDLSGLELRYGTAFHLTPQPGAALVASAQGTDSTLTIGQSRLTLAPFTGSLSGSLDWAAEPAAHLAVRIELPELGTAGELIPAVGSLQLRGGAALTVAVDGPLTSVQPRISLELREIHIPTHGVTADIAQLSGLLLLDGKEVRSEKLTARLGKSPVMLQMRIADLQAPRLELGVKASAIRADELIFRSDRIMLRDISGQLLIDRDGIVFAPVNVRLDGGTRATVRGSVRDFAKPRVELDISGDYANVGEIIGLWTDESPDTEKTRLARYATVPPPPIPPTRIQVDAKSGNLYGMQFSKAKALIVPTTASLLIHPLDFNVGEGYCTTQVLVDYSGAHTALRVSGHVEDVDAYQVVNELLGHKSIMRGSLRGDFYLQGELGGGRFLPTSFGNVNATVRDGVMRHSPILATVFSLLNVSQLFSFKLPDVNREGVPFTRLATELAIDKGILHSDLVVLDSEAMNMSYVGQYDMIKDDLDLLVVVKPLGTIDKVVTHLPIAGWILGGEEKALVTAQFKVTGPGANPEVEAIPISAMSKGVLGIFQRTLSLPLKIIEDPAILWGGGGKKQ